MLYERWRQVARMRAGEMALRDCSTGRRWTFAELSRLAETASPEPIVYPQGPDFILAVLRGWRSQAVVCPLESGQPPPAVPVPSHPCCHLKTTSATTGAPRAIAFTADQLAADVDNIANTMGLRPDWPNLGVLSMAHSYGFSNLVLPLLLHGIPLILVPSPLPEIIRSAAGFGPALTLAAVPAMWSAWHEAGAIPGNVRLAISAGAPLRVDLERVVFETTGIKIHNFYGSSECGGIAYDTSMTPRNDDSFVGVRMQNVGLSLNGDGCLTVSGSAVGETYWPEADESLGKGVFQTSDIAELRGDNVYLRGRFNEQINIAGRKVSPAVIEQALRQHHSVVDCLVFGVPDRMADRADLIVACIQTGGKENPEELKQFLLAKIPGWQVPRHWWFVDALSANQRGKISRAAWRVRYLEKVR